MYSNRQNLYAWDDKVICDNVDLSRAMLPPNSGAQSGGPTVQYLDPSRQGVPAGSPAHSRPTPLASGNRQQLFGHPPTGSSSSSLTAALMRQSPRGAKNTRSFISVINPPDPLEDVEALMFDPEVEVHGGAETNYNNCADQEEEDCLLLAEVGYGGGRGYAAMTNMQHSMTSYSAAMTSYPAAAASTSSSMYPADQESWQLARNYSTIIGPDGYGYAGHYMVPKQVNTRSPVLSVHNRQRAIPDRHVISPVIGQQQQQPVVGGHGANNWRFIKRGFGGPSATAGQKGSNNSGFGGPKVKLTLSASLRDVKEWTVHKDKFELVFDVYGMVDSDVTVRESNRLEFLLRDHSDTTWISYYEIDAKLADLNRGDWIRIAAVMRPWHLQAVHVRVIPPESIRVIKQKIDNSRRMLEDKLKGR